MSRKKTLYHGSVAEAFFPIFCWQLLLLLAESGEATPINTMGSFKSRMIIFNRINIIFIK